MNWLEMADRYVKMRRKMGYRYVREAKWVRQFALHADAHGEAFMRAETAIAWACDGVSLLSARRRLAVLCEFAQWLAVEDDRHEVPPENALGSGSRPRPSPYLLSTDEIAVVLNAAKALGSPGSITGETYFAMFGLMAATGLRRGEARKLRLGDVTPDGLVIRGSKFGKSRLVPLSQSVQRYLRDYLKKRRRVAGGCDHLFVLTTGRRPSLLIMGQVFRKLLQGAGIRQLGVRRGPSLHSLRHSFAVRSLEQCVSTNPDAVRRHAYALSVYLGHKNVENTYWYLEATPTLLRGIAALAEDAYAGRSAS